MAENTAVTPQSKVVDENAPVNLQDVRDRGLSTRPKTSAQPVEDPRAVISEMGIKTRQVDPTVGETSEALGTGFARGAAESATLMGSTVLGGKMGTAAAPFAGPAAPFMPVAGAAGGFLYGLYASDIVGSMFPEAQQEDLISSYEGARTFGGGLAFAPSVMFLKPATKGAGKIKQTIGAIGEYARANKGKYYTTEALASLYAGVAGGAAAEYFPDSPFMRPAVEISAGYLPSKWAPQLASSAVNALKKGASQTTATGYSDATKDYVSNQLINVIESAGEDPKEIVKAVNDFIAPQFDAVPKATIAQMTGSPIFTKLQSTIARSNAKYSGDTKEMGEEALRAYGDIVRQLENTGDPSLLAAAAALRKDNLQKQFQTSFNIAQTNAVERATKLGSRGSDNRLVVGNILQDEMQKLLRTARESETQLWQNAIRSTFKEADGKLTAVKTKPTNFAEALYDVTSSPFSSGSRGEISSELAGLNKDLSRLGFNKQKLKAMEGIEVTPEYLETRSLDPEAISSLGLKDASAVDMVRFRGSLLEKAREAAGAGKSSAARRYTILANAILNDLDELPGGQYAEARAFSRELNDSFTRTFAGDVSAVNRQGGDVISPEVLVQNAFTSGADSTLQRMKEMEKAADFVDPSGKAAVSVRDAEQRVVRAFASESLNPDGTVDANALDRFRAKHADTLKFLGMEEEFADISSAQRALLEVNDPDSLLKTRIKDEQAFKLLLEVDDPATAVSKALTNTKQPVKNFKSLVETASTATDPAKREAARRGLLSTIYQYAYQTANKTGTFRPQDFNDVFFKPLSPNNPSLANMMRSTDLMSGDELGRLKQITNKMTNVENALTTQARIVDPDAVFAPQDAVEDLAFTMLGAKFAGAVGPGGPGSLAFASKAINATRKFFSGTPARQRLMLLEEATKDPMLFKELMSRNPSAAEARNTQVSMLRHLYSPAVLPTAIDRYVETSDPEPEQPNPRAAAMLRSLPPAPVTRGTPNLPITTAQGPAQTAQAQQPAGQPPVPPTGASSREMLQRLFPFDMS